MAFRPFPFICAYCGHHQSVTQNKFCSHFDYISVGDNCLGKFGIETTSIGCANQKCEQVTIFAQLVHSKISSHGMIPEEPRRVIQSLTIRPESLAKRQPEYIPQAIREDYEEACRIRDLSPKASATLSRRCLQGMIRDFCGIREKSLWHEVQKLQSLLDANNAPPGVTIESIEAIDAIRNIGNIGAHMEKDVNQIVSVDPEEAQIMIDLIESLFQDWYIEKNTREVRFKRVKDVATQKALMIEGFRVQENDSDKIE